MLRMTAYARVKCVLFRNLAVNSFNIPKYLALRMIEIFE